jgi:hypothetical protein
LVILEAAEIPSEAAQSSMLAGTPTHHPEAQMQVPELGVALGHELQLQLQVRELKRWAEVHMAQVFDARNAYDARAAQLVE